MFWRAAIRHAAPRLFMQHLNLNALTRLRDRRRLTPALHQLLKEQRAAADEISGKTR